MPDVVIEEASISDVPETFKLTIPETTSAKITFPVMFSESVLLSDKVDPKLTVDAVSVGLAPKITAPI